MRALQHVPVGAIDPRRFRDVVSIDAYEALLSLIERAAADLAGRVVWNVNSTARGGGVVELLRPLVGYARGAGVDARWAVISGGAGFFTLTKHLHNRLHGFDGDQGLQPADRALYEGTLAANGAELAREIRRGDIVILHDPQTAGLAEPVRRAGATVIWRCHVGLDRPNETAREAWAFLEPYVRVADAYVFSRRAFAWEGLETERIRVIQPSIDAFAVKNQPHDPEVVRAILVHAGILEGPAAAPATFTRSDGTPGRIGRRATMLQAGPLRRSDQLVLQVSRWDRLKDPARVIQGFTEHVAGRSAAHLLLAGPATEAVADDPEGAAVYAEVAEAWQALAPAVRRRVHLASLPMDDLEENAAMVNALQRHADVVVQKSLAEGFGLTVAEAMWKRRPVVASRIGGIQDQIVDGESGVLLSDPADPAEFGAAVSELLAEPERRERIGGAAQERVRDHFLAPQHLGHYFDLLRELDAHRAPRPYARSGVAPRRRS